MFPFRSFAHWSRWNFRPAWRDRTDRPDRLPPAATVDAAADSSSSASVDAAVYRGAQERSRNRPLSRHDDEIGVPAGLLTKALIGDQQRGSRGHQRDNTIERFRRQLDTVKRFDGGLAQGVSRRRPPALSVDG